MSRLSIPLAGPSNVLDSRLADAEETINLFSTTTAPGGGKVPAYLRKRPGLSPWLELPTIGVTALFQQDQRAFAIAGDTFYELSTLPNYTAAGTTLATGAYLPTICSNGSAGNQLFIVSGELGYIFDLTTNSLTQITDPGFPTRVRMGAFSDGYFAASVTESRAWQLSALEDGTSWDALDVAERSIASDQIAAFIRTERLFALLGVQTSEFWYDSGDPLFPYQPTGQLLEHGIAAPFTAQRFSDTLVWVGQDQDGLGVVWRLEGNTVRVISTRTINRLIQHGGLGATNDLRTATAFTYQEDGHNFYLLQLPVCDYTLVYDLMLDRWYKWAVWDSTQCVFLKWRPQCHMYWPDAGKHLVGDRLTGTIYDLSLENLGESLVAV
jgi:hypothetical protein